MVTRPTKGQGVPPPPGFHGKDKLVEKVRVSVRVRTRRRNGTSDRVAMAKRITVGLRNVTVGARRVLRPQVGDEVVGGALCGIGTSVIQCGHFLRRPARSRRSSASRRLVKSGRQTTSLQGRVANACGEAHRRLKGREGVGDVVRRANREHCLTAMRVCHVTRQLGDRGESTRQGRGVRYHRHTSHRQNGDFTRGVNMLRMARRSRVSRRARRGPYLA